MERLKNARVAVLGIGGVGGKAKYQEIAISLLTAGYNTLCGVAIGNLLIIVYNSNTI